VVKKKEIKSILLSQPKPIVTDSLYFNISKEYGIAVDFRPFIEVKAINIDEFRKFRIKILESTVVYFTTRAAIDHFFIMCKECNVTLSPDITYIFQSEQLSLYITKYASIRKRKMLVYDKDAKKLATIFNSQQHRYIIISSNNRNNHILPEIKSNHRTEITVYNTVPTNLQDLDIQKYDVITFFSPIDVDAFIHNFPSFKSENKILATFGTNTTEHMKNYGLTPTLSGPLPGASSMGSMLERYIKSHGSNV
jgi:uroporphyrinogen-III synthase